MDKKNNSWGMKRFLITQMPNILFFLVFITSVALTWLIDWIPWLLLPGTDVTNWWRLIELILGYVFIILAAMFVTWGTVSLSLDRATGTEIGGKEEKGELVTSGAYSYCRHPITFGFLFATPGTFFIFDLIPLLLTTIIYTLFLFLFLAYEERELIERFGDTYLQYKKAVSYLIPKKRVERSNSRMKIKI